MAIENLLQSCPVAGKVLLNVDHLMMKQMTRMLMMTSTSAIWLLKLSTWPASTVFEVTFVLPGLMIRSRLDLDKFNQCKVRLHSAKFSWSLIAIRGASTGLISMECKNMDKVCPGLIWTRTAEGNFTNSHHARLLFC